MNKNLITRLNYEKLRNEAHAEYGETIADLIVKYDPQALGIKPGYDVYKTSLDVEISALDVIRKSQYTDEISEQDHIRDGIFRGFADAIKSALNHFDAGKRKAAQRVNIVIEHYGNIAVKAMDQETAAIDDLLRELNDNYTADIAALNTADWLAQLDTENTRFKTLMAERYTETAQRPSTSMRTARTETDKALRALLNMLEALIMVNGADKYAALADEINAVNKRYKNLIAQSEGRKEKNDE
jgi:cell division protein ZapA (FtsZ GTPase activity inhibitor)